MQLNRDSLRALIAEPYLSRGYDYFQEGMVHLTSLSSQSVKARVVGTRTYRVTLTLKGPKLNGECSCPSFQDFGPCKHMAATAFAIMSANKEGYRTSSNCTQQVEEQDEFENFLQKMTKKELVDIILDLSNDYPEIVDYLMDEEWD